MKRISTSWQKFRDNYTPTTYDAIIVGSGYGGAIAAARLAEAGWNVCLLERGREIRPGGYPDTLAAALAETQITTAKHGRVSKSTDGLLDLRLNDDVNVIVGCGLGGTSLINANVSLETNPDTFQLRRTDGDQGYFWPEVYRSPGALDVYYEKASKMLGVNPLPDEFHPDKLKALEASAKGMGQVCERAPINVTFQTGLNAAGVQQQACTMCGDCCSGCNFGAKNTTLMNYLPYAQLRGAVIVTQAKVSHVNMATDGQSATVTVEDGDNPIEMNAKCVILAAGTLGSTEILLRSAANGLAVSKDNVGKRFSGNGDVLGFAFDADMPETDSSGKTSRRPVNGIGSGKLRGPDGAPEHKPGPCITGMINMNASPELGVRGELIIEEGVAPGALAPIYPAMFFMQEALNGDLTRFADVQERLGDMQDLGAAVMAGGDLTQLSFSGAMSRTQSFLVMSHDNSAGEICLSDDQTHISVVWQGAGSEFPYVRDNEVLENASDAISANFLTNPVWNNQFGYQLFSVHPLGGCCLSDSAEYGVADADCRVFTGDADAVHNRILVCDGAVLPTSVGLNPLLTISAIAERTMERLIGNAGAIGVEVAKPMRKAPLARAAAAPQPSPGGWTLMSRAVRGAMSRLQNLDDAIEGKDWDTAVDQTMSIVEDLYELAGWSLSSEKRLWMSRYLSSSEDLPNDIQPSVRQCLGVLDVINKCLDQNTDNYTALIDTFIDQMGDFSPGFSFSETMFGYGGPVTASGDPILSSAHELAARRGRAARETLKASFGVQTDHVAQFLTSDSHTACLTGQVIWSKPGDDGKADIKTYQIREGTGRFRLLETAVDRVETWIMTYTGTLERSGETLQFEGTKTLNRQAGAGWWCDLTTLAVDITQAGPPARVVFRGILQLDLQDFMRQLQTVQIAIPDQSGNDIFDRLHDAAFPKWDGVGNLHGALADMDNRRDMMLKMIDLARSKGENLVEDIDIFQSHFQMQLVALFAVRIFRAYGGVSAYLANFPEQDRARVSLPPESGAQLRNRPEVVSELIRFPNETGEILQIIRYNGGDKGPVILAPGFATRAQSFVIETVDQNLVEALCAKGYDVWLFDYRGSPALGETSLAAFTLDDIAQADWPAAVDLVLERTGKAQVQIVAHCVGSMSCLMALLCGTLDGAKVRSLVSSQLTVHPVAFWLNQMKADTGVARAIIEGVPKWAVPVLSAATGDPGVTGLFEGLSQVNANSDPGPDGQVSNADQAINLLTWTVPFPNGRPCYSPTCHRIFGIYGPVYAHEQLNEETHVLVQDLFGKISSKPFEQMALMLTRGIATNAEGQDVYLPHPERLRLPISFMAGALNQEFLPDTSLRTYRWLREENADVSHLYRRMVFPDYAHMDCFIGKNASLDVFGFIVEELDRYAD